MFHEKQWNDLLIYVKSGVIEYPQPRLHNSVGWASSRVWVIRDLLNTYHVFFHEVIRVCTAQATN